MKKTTQLFAVLFFVTACSNKAAPISPTSVQQEPTKPVGSSLTPASAPAPKPTPTPVVTSAPTTTSEATEAGLEIDCKKFPEEPAPSRRWLCDLAMSKSQGSIVDAQGFALVTEFESPGEDSPGFVDEGHLKKRVCGAEAEEYAKRLGQDIRYYFSLEEGSEKFVSCDKKSCSLTGMGEYSTNITLTFRSTAKGPVLDSWSEIEVVLVSEQEINRREASIAKGLKDLAKSTCK
jgi:hypothetical protein